MKEIILRIAARRLNLTHYYTGKACKNGHVDSRFVGDGRCMSCGRESSKAYRDKDPSKANQRVREWRSKNQDHVKSYNKDIWETVKLDQTLLDKKREANKRYISTPEHKSRKKSYDRLYNQKWRKLNRDKANARAAKRRGQKLKATPCWLTEKDHHDIVKFYERAQELTKICGELQVVDHIIPLKGKTVCGLHVPWNLQILSDHDNKAKGSRYDGAQSIF